MKKWKAIPMSVAVMYLYALLGLMLYAIDVRLGGRIASIAARCVWLAGGWGLWRLAYYCFRNHPMFEEPCDER